MRPASHVEANLDNRHGNIQHTLDTLFITTRKKKVTQQGKKVTHSSHELSIGEGIKGKKNRNKL